MSFLLHLATAAWSVPDFSAAIFFCYVQPLLLTAKNWSCSMLAALRWNLSLQMCGISQPALLPLLQHCSPGRLRAEPWGLAGSLCLQPLERAREGAAEGVRLETGGWGTAGLKLLDCNGQVCLWTQTVALAAGSGAYLICCHLGLNEGNTQVLLIRAEAGAHLCGLSLCFSWPFICSLLCFRRSLWFQGAAFSVQVDSAEHGMLKKRKYCAYLK